MTTASAPSASRLDLPAPQLDLNFVRSLPRSEKQTIASLIAILLRTRVYSSQDVKERIRILELCAVELLQLPQVAVDALAPLIAERNSHSISCKPFVDEIQDSAMRLKIVISLLHLPLLGGCGYDARARQLVQDAASTLAIDWNHITKQEALLAHDVLTSGLETGGEEVQGEEAPPDEAHTARSGKGKVRHLLRRWKKGACVASIGLASGVAVAVTAGIAAPAVIGGLAAVGGGGSSLGGAAVAVGGGIAGVATALSGTAGIIVVSTLFGATGAGLAGYKMNRRLAGVSEFQFLPPPFEFVKEVRNTASSCESFPVEAALHVCICISGWIEMDASDSTGHWWGRGHCGDKSSTRGSTQANKQSPVKLQDKSRIEEERRCESVDWLVAMGFDRTRAVAVAATSPLPSVENMVEVLMSNGVTPNLKTAATAPQPIPPPQAIIDASEAISSMESTATDQCNTYGRRGPKLQKAQVKNMPPSAQNRTIIDMLPYCEHYVLNYESTELKRLGSALSSIAATEALSVVATQALKHTFLSTLMAAVAVPAYLIKASSLIDHPWAVANARSTKAGRLLAKALASRAHGARPVILCGFSLGAHVIWECLQELSRFVHKGDQGAKGIVQHAILLGSPSPSDSVSWTNMREVVAGRLVNCYRETDIVLSLVYRGMSLGTSVAGLVSVNVDGVENFEVSDIVGYHHEYRRKANRVLAAIGLS